MSKISFSIKLARKWDEIENKRSLLPERHADVYVFCLLKHEEKSTVDPLNMDHWDFYILSTNELNSYTRSQHFITLKSLQKLTKPNGYDKIAEIVLSKNQLNT